MTVKQALAADAMGQAEVVCRRDSHQQTGLSTGTITDDDEFASDFGHDGWS